MGYEVFTSLRLESLVKENLHLFRGGFFGPRPVVVLQTQSLAQWLKLFLAKETGGYLTGDFLYQDGAIRRLLTDSGADVGQILFLDDLKLALYRTLSAELSGEVDPVFAPLAGRGKGPDPLRLFELADHISGVFHNYAMNSRVWPQALGTGNFPPGSEADPGAFGWQSRLWSNLLSGDQGTLAGLVMDRFTAAPPPPLLGPVPELVIVGSAFLSRRTAAFLRAWADAGLVNVTQLLLLPASGSDGPWPDQRPWSSWGAFGQAFLGMLPPVAPVHDKLDFPETALGSVQRSLTLGQMFPGAAPDSTLRIVSCPHPLRELEILRDRLLEALGADPDLQVHEIAVLAPDINVYAPFLDAAFGSDIPGRNLSFHVIDLDLGKENAWFRALDALLALASGTLDRPTLFALADTPAFREAWSVDDDERDLWLDYTEEVSAWREEPGDRISRQSWTSGADRLFTGWFRANPGPDGIPPLGTTPSAFVSLGKFQKLIASLKTLGTETGRVIPFGGWVKFLERTMAEYLAPGDGTGAVLTGRLRTLDTDSGTRSDPMTWTGFRAFVQDQIAHFPGRRGQLLTEGIHCSSLRPLRSIPFKVIAVLGLDEGNFPRQAPVPSFDLMRHEPGQDQVSSLALDRYCFWETLMAARDSLHLSFRGRSPVDGTELPPSPVLADLMDYLEESGRPWPVDQASVKDFAGTDDPPATWSVRTWRRAGAVARAVSQDSQPRPIPEVTDEEINALFPEVRTAEVVQAFTVPGKFHLKRVRQLALKDEDHRGIDDEEPWSLGFLGRQSWVQEGLRLRLSGQNFSWDAGQYLWEMEATGRLRPGVFTDRDRRDMETLGAQASRWADELLADHWVLEPPKTPGRTRWAGRPWALEPGDRLVRGREVRYFRLLYSQGSTARTVWDPALRLVLDPASKASLETLNPSGVRRVFTWTLDPDRTETLGTRAEEYWLAAARSPLPFYPDFLETVSAKLTGKNPVPWDQAVEEAWKSCKGYSFSQSDKTLGNCPYAAVAFPDDPEWETLANQLKPWWDTLFQPLLGAWS